MKKAILAILLMITKVTIYVKHTLMTFQVSFIIICHLFPVQKYYYKIRSGPLPGHTISIKKYNVSWIYFLTCLSCHTLLPYLHIYKNNAIIKFNLHRIYEKTSQNRSFIANKLFFHFAFRYLLSASTIDLYLI